MFKIKKSKKTKKYETYNFNVETDDIDLEDIETLAAPYWDPDAIDTLSVTLRYANNRYINSKESTYRPIIWKDTYEDDGLPKGQIISVTITKLIRKLPD